MLQENNNKLPKLFWIILISFILIPTIVSVVSTIHVINFFELSNNSGLALTLAIAFEAGALSALAGLVALDKINKNVVYVIFFLLTAYQIMGNVYAAYDFISNVMIKNPDLIKNWTELFGFSNDIEDMVMVKRIIAIVSGAILPIVSLCFLDLSVDYIQKSTGLKLNKPIGKNKKEESEKSDSNNIIFENTPVEEQKVETEQEHTNTSEVPFIKEIKPVSEETNETKTEEKQLLSDIFDEDNDMGEDNFEEFLKEKKKKLESLKEPYLTLLLILYKGGELEEKDELPSYPEFINMVPKERFNQHDIKKFLILCNYLEIFKVSGTQKIALKSYAEAIKALDGYLSWN